jgi:uncharacterized membrane protein YsdA (DUF1294 family)
MLALYVVVPRPVWIYLLMSVLTFLAYWWDKSAARGKRWRIRENVLHLLALLGGWPGGLVAQQILRHKNRKAGFQVIFWMIGVIHAVNWLWRYGVMRV